MIRVPLTALLATAGLWTSARLLNRRPLGHLQTFMGWRPRSASPRKQTFLGANGTSAKCRSEHRAAFGVPYSA
jgi:hypothetical protein